MISDPGGMEGQPISNFYEKGGQFLFLEGDVVLTPLFFADIICEQPLPHGEFQSSL